MCKLLLSLVASPEFCLQIQSRGNYEFDDHMQAADLLSRFTKYANSPLFLVSYLLTHMDMAYVIGESGPLYKKGLL